jgi:hypothetical protein
MSRKSSPVPAIQSESSIAQQQAIVPSRQTRVIQPSQRHGVPRPTAKSCVSRLPRPTVVRIQARYIAGENQTQIAKAERCDRETVSRIVKSSEMAEYVERMKEEFRGLVPDALAAVRHALQEQKDARIAYQLLRDTGVIPSPEELTQSAMQQSAPDATPLTPFESAMLGLAAIAEQTSETYGFPLPNPQEMKHNLEIAQEVDRMTNGKAMSISLSDSIEWNRLTKLAEQRLKDACK